MQFKRFSMIFVAAAMAATAAMAGPPRAADITPGAHPDLVLVQSVREQPLDAVPPVDTGRAPPSTNRAGPPAPPPVPPAPRLSTRTAPPPAAEDDAPPTREVPPPPTSTSRYTAPPPPAPPRAQEPAYRPAPRTEEPPPTASAPRRPPPTRSAFYANCTQQCHLSCEASFEACNGDSSPAKPACVKKLETCRIERCACRFD